MDEIEDERGFGATVRPMELEDVSGHRSPPRADSPAGLGRVLDVTVALTARVGEVRKTVSEIVDLAPGTIIDLGRGASEPVELVIGDKLIARGDIVVVDDRYGVRITEILQD